MVGLLVQHHASSPAVKRGERPRLLGRFGGSRHEKRVSAIALRLFDLLAPLHGLDNSYRNVLRIGALLHDAGRAFGADDHHMTGANMVMDDRSLDLTPCQRRCIAYLVRYHRGKVPASPKSEIL